MVVLTALGSPCLEWTSVADAVGEYTTVCLYDRPGLGWSDTAPGLASVGRMADDLRHVLSVGDLPAPYILVGHSLGGYAARVYAARWPEDVAGLVLVDSPHEKQREYIRLLDRRTRLRGVLIRAGAGLCRLMPLGLVRLAIDLGWAEGRKRRARARFPPEYADAGLALSMRTGLRRATAGEVYALLTAPAVIGAGAAHLGCVPLVVVTRAPAALETVSNARRLSARRRLRIATVLKMWATLQKELTALSTQSTLLVASRSGHHVHRDEPQLIIDAVRQLVLRHPRDGVHSR